MAPPARTATVALGLVLCSPGLGGIICADGTEDICVFLGDLGFGGRFCLSCCAVDDEFGFKRL